MRTLRLYFNDLTKEAQEKYLKVQGVSNPSELNWEINPVAIIEVEEETLQGMFVSVWDDGSSIETEGTLDLQTGKIETTPANDSSDHGSLVREYFVDSNDEEHEVCTECHEYILKTSMDPDQVGKGLSEVKTCPNCK